MTWTPVNLPPAGWYPDPGGEQALRWWDGRAWTRHLSPSVYGTSVPPQTGAVARGGGEPPAVSRGSDEPPAVPARAAWWALAGVGGGFLLSGLLQAIAYAIFPGSNAALILFGEIGLWTGLGASVVLVSRHYGTGSLSVDFGLAWRWGDIGYGLLAAIGCFWVAVLISAAFRGSRFSGSNTQIITSQKGSTIGVAVVTMIAAVGAPLVEELFFRGFLRRALASRIGAGAIWAQAVCFGFAHYQFGLGLGNVSVVAATAGLGVVLGYTARLTRRLGAGMLAHGLFNFSVTLTIIAVLRARP